MKDLTKERVPSMNLKPRRIGKNVRIYFITDAGRMSIAISISEPKPCCAHCGSEMTLVPFRVSGEDGVRYVQRPVCSNQNGEGACPAYHLDGKQVIDIEAEEVTA